jgi:hypothetical protein
MTDAFEAVIQTDRCNPDTDGDSMWDLWEYESALALNGGAGGVPYPGKRPYPNPLDGSDANIDFDGDGLLAWMEHRLWEKIGSRALPLNYSDGDQTTLDGAPIDSARDADGDALNNYVEANGPAELARLVDQVLQGREGVSRAVQGDRFR